MGRIIVKQCEKLKTPEFSIIVPVYNVSRYLRQCVDSIIQQTFTDFEIILVDDGSTDSSGEICDVYERMYPAVTVIHEKNSGPAGARNIGIGASSGKWILFVDSDDWIDPDTLKVLYSHICQSNLELYCWNVKTSDKNGNLLEKNIFTPENDIIRFRDEKDKFSYFFHMLMQYKCGWEVYQRAFRRNIIVDNRLEFYPISEVFAEDYLFTFEYLLYVNNIGLICNIFYNYRQLENSLIHHTDKSTVIPRLYQFAAVGYLKAQTAHLSYFCKHYEELYFMLLNYHIKNLLSGLPEQKIRELLVGLNTFSLHRKWMKRIRKDCTYFEKYMGDFRWV